MRFPTNLARPCFSFLVLLGLVIAACHDDEPVAPAEAGEGGALDAPLRDADVAEGFDAADVATESASPDLPRACFASDDGNWTPVTSLDTTGCESRPLGACAEQPSLSSDQALWVHLLAFVQQQCQLRTHVFVEVGFVAGCPSRFRIKDGIGRPIPAELGVCLARALPGVRWDCALGAACATVEQDTLP